MDVEKTIEFILERQAQTAAIHARHEAEIVRLDARLRRAIRLAVAEARQERRRRRELDERFERKMDQLASAQLLSGQRIEKLGEKVDKLVEGWRESGNGHPQP